MDDKKIIELIGDTVKKLEASTSLDSKLINDMNNALNWLLVLTTVSFAFYVKQFDQYLACLDSIVVSGNKLTFTLLITLLIVHKIVFFLYEKQKGLYFESLRTHQYELKYNLQQFKAKLTDNISFFDFFNQFIKGDFIPYSNLGDDRAKHFERLDRIICRYGLTLKLTFWAVIVLFSLYFIGVIILIY